MVCRSLSLALPFARRLAAQVLRAHMHGFFMDVRLYAEAKAMVDPFAYDEYRKAKIEKLLDEGTAKRIKLKRAARALPKVRHHSSPRTRASLHTRRAAVCVCRTPARATDVFQLLRSLSVFPSEQVNRHLAQRMLSDDPKKTEKAKKRARKLAEEKGQEPSDDEGDDAEDGASAAPDSRYFYFYFAAPVARALCFGATAQVLCGLGQWGSVHPLSFILCWAEKTSAT